MADDQALIRSTYQASAATWPFTAVSTILFGMRTFSRIHETRDTLHWDDLVLSVSWVRSPPRPVRPRCIQRVKGADCFIKQILDVIRASVFQKTLESARQINHQNISQTVPTATFWIIFTDNFAFLSIALPKLGVGILIVRLFRPQRWLKNLILTLCSGLNILAIIGFIITYIQCDPVAGQWDPFAYPQTSCWNRAVQIIYSCAVGGTYTEIKIQSPLAQRLLMCPIQVSPRSWTLPSLPILPLLFGVCNCLYGKSLVR